MNLSGAAAILMAVAAVITAAWGIRQNRRGEAKEEVQEAAANKLAERVENYKELSSYADRLEQQLTRAQAALDARDEKHAAEMSRLSQQCDRRQHEQDERCRAHLTAALDNVHTLQSIVADEIAKSSAFEVEDSGRRHLTTDHPDDEGEAL